MVHGRGSTPEDILGLSTYLGVEGARIVAPAAASGSWYPYSFLAPIPQNEPGLSSALGLLDHLVEELAGEGVPRERVVLLGFSQGACLTSEFVARHARRYGGLIAFSGGLIGPPGTPRNYAGSLAGTPVFLGCSDVDPHIPAERVRESAAVLSRLGAAVDVRLYPGMPHTVIDDEVQAARAILTAAAATAESQPD
jgi:predicted esterase